MVLDDTILLLLFVEEQFSTSNLAPADEPTIFGKVTEYIGLACTFGGKFNYIETRLK